MEFVWLAAHDPLVDVRLSGAVDAAGLLERERGALARSERGGVDHAEQLPGGNGAAEAPRGRLDTIPRNLPALVEAQQISSKAAAVGFDWENANQVLDKLDEELHELAQARETGSQNEREGEIGDLLFVLVNLARFLKVDPEQALRRTNAKFRKRFAYIESRAALPGATIAEMETLWQEAKSVET